MTTQVFVSEEEEHFAAQSAHWIATRIREAQTRRGVCTLGLSGGSTPGPVHRRIAALGDYGAFSWAELEVFLVDERCVPPDHEDSNERLARETLLDLIEDEDERPVFHGVWQDGLDFEACAKRYEGLLPERFDILLLGLGPDGHTASLFPGHDALHEETRRVIHVQGPKPPPDRWTLTPRELRAAELNVMLVRGASKAPKVAAAIEGDADIHELPGALAREGAWFLDLESASHLHDPTRS